MARSRFEFARQPCRRRTLRWLTLLLAVSGVGLSSAQAGDDGTTVLRTDGSAGLHAASFDLVLPPDLDRGPLEFRFGFESDESPEPGQFLDTLTLTLRSARGFLGIALLRADAGGVTFAPSMPGLFPFDDAGISRVTIPPPGSGETLAHHWSFSVQTIVPDPFAGQTATLSFQLSDNQNGIPSRAWLSGVTLVPEPEKSALLGLGVLACAVARWRYRWRQRDKSRPDAIS